MNTTKFGALIAKAYALANDGRQKLAPAPEEYGISSCRHIIDATQESACPSCCCHWHAQQ
jgi:hypothetical protein